MSEHIEQTVATMALSSARSAVPWCCIALVAVLALGCGDDDAERECRPDEERACSCGGTPSVESCSPTGAWGPCQCDDAGTTAPDGAACECASGRVETRPTADCGEETRECTDCAWGTWHLTAAGVEDPVCLLGDTRLDPSEAEFRDGCAQPGPIRHYPCVDCRGFATEQSECGGGCPGVRRTEPPDAEEICVPSRKYVRGCEEEGRDCYPRHEVQVSAFYIDKYEVTVRRYQECVRDGACTPLEPFTTREDSTIPNFTFDDLSFGDPSIPVWTATHAQAEAFCAWDGAALISGAQWELAAIGYYDSALLPVMEGRDYRARTYAWLLELCYMPACFEQTILPPREAFPFDYLVDYGRSSSMTGIENLFWFFEWTRDSLAPYDPPAAVERDPVSLGGPPYERRGTAAQVPAGTLDIAARDATAVGPESFQPFELPPRAAIRCARQALSTPERRRP